MLSFCLQAKKKQLNINIEMSHLQRSYFLILKIVVPYIQKLLIYFSISSVARSPGFFFLNSPGPQKNYRFQGMSQISPWNRYQKIIRYIHFHKLRTLKNRLIKNY